METRLLKTIILTILMMGSALQAMDVGQADDLIRAASGGDIAKVEELIASGANVNTKGAFGVTALMYAANYGKEEVCELLINAGADVNAKDAQGRRALMYASQNGHKDICELLLAAGAEINPRDKDGNTALMNAAKHGHGEVCKLLINAGADAGVRNKFGNTVLMSVAIDGQRDICKLLINAMINSTKKKVSLGTLLGISKKQQSEQLDAMTPHAVKQLNKPKVKVEINQITDKKMKQELLDYLDSI